MIQQIEQELQKAVDDQIFPNAELIVAKNNQVEVHSKVGHSSHTYFDLASLTKPLCTALCIAKLTEQNKLRLDQTVDEFFQTKTLKNIPISKLLNHTSGLRDWYPFYKKRVNETKPDTQKNKAEIIDMILIDESLQTKESKTVYSDLGFIILGQIIELVTKQSLDQAFQNLVATPLDLKDTFFNPTDFPKAADSNLFYPSEESDSRKRTLQGEVMDDNCFAMGGVCGHAGLFGTAQDIHKILLELEQAQRGQSSFLKESTFKQFCWPDENRKSRQFYFTLGFDTPTQGLSQSGSLMSPQTIGHLGFSGTSFWWDLQKNTWVILLTNRCYPDRKNFKISNFRPQFHDFILKTLS